MNKKFKKSIGFIVALLCISSFSAFGQMSTRFAHPTASSTAPLYLTGNCTGSDIAKGITIDGFGNSYVVGTFTGTAAYGTTPMFTSSGSNDVFLEKYDNRGTPLWAVHAGGAGDDDAKSVAVYPDGTGGVNIYVTGYFTNSITFNGVTGSPVTVNSVFANNIDMYIVKYLNNGSIQWARRFGRNAGAGITIGYDIAVSDNATTSTVDIWVSGSFKGSVSFGTHTITSAGGQNGFIANFHDAATAPNDVWVNGVLSASLVAQALGICPDNVGNVYLTGYWLYGSNANFGGTFTAVTPIGQDDGFVASYDGSGAIQNVTHFGHTTGGSQGTSAQGVAVALDGSIYVVGGFTDTTKFEITPSAISRISTGGPGTGSDAFFMKLDAASLNIIYVNQLSSSTADDVAKRVVVDHCGKRAYVAGDYAGTEDFGNGVTMSLPPGGYGESSFVVDFDISNPFVGNAFHRTQAGGNVPVNTTFTTAYDLAVNSVEDVQYCGSFSSGNLVCDPPDLNGNSANAIVAGGVKDGFVVRWDDSEWPALEATGLAINQGVSSVNCVDYAVGDMSGNNVTFGTLPSLSTNGFWDIYLITLDKYATYLGFKKLTNGTATETSVDLVSNSSMHYIAGNAIPTTGQTVTFTLDATDSYTATATNAGPTAVVMRTSLGLLTGWGTTIRPGAGGGAAAGTGVAYDASGNVYFCGYFSGSVNIYSTGQTLFGSLTSNGSNDIFVVKYNSLGVVQWTKKIGGSSDDKANGISIDPASANYYITGQVSGTVLMAQGLAHTHFAPSTDGFVLRGNPATGAAINDAFWTTASTADRGYDIYSNGLDEVYITGVKTVNNVYIARYDLTGTASPASSWWSLISGGSGVGNDIVLGRNGYVYVSGVLTNTTLSFGTLPVLNAPLGYGGYIVGVTSWGGTATWETSVYTNAKFCNGLAEDVGYLMSDHGFICLIAGQNDFNTGNHAYVQKATEEGLEFSSRHANPALAENTETIESTSSAIYPNPFNQAAVLKLDAAIDLSTPATLFVFDLSGRIVNRVDEITSQETTISAGEMANGIYFYEVIQNGNILTTGKMMINK
jgi:hypothetical protein